MSAMDLLAIASSSDVGFSGRCRDAHQKKLKADERENQLTSQVEQVNNQQTNKQIK